MSSRWAGAASDIVSRADGSRCAMYAKLLAEDEDMNSKKVDEGKYAEALPVEPTTVDSMDAVSPALWREAPTNAFKYGWSEEDGKWYDMPRDGILKWWQRPGYLTPNGYPEPPMWSKRNYQLCLEEVKFANMEANFMKDLKARGMTREEIDARAELYEFLEDDDKPKMTKKMTKLMAVSALWRGSDPDELIDMRRGRDKDKKKYYKQKKSPKIRINKSA